MIQNSRQPAFPDPRRGVSGSIGETGLSKRELLAGMAMQGFLASYAGVGTVPNRELVAEKSIGYADELLKQLEK